MGKTRVQFYVSITEDTTPDEMILRVEKALDIKLNRVDPHDPGEKGVWAKTKTLGFWILFGGYWPSYKKEKKRTFNLSGFEDQDIREEGKKFTLILISEFIKDVLVKRDGGKWYIPTEKELNKELEEINSLN